MSLSVQKRREDLFRRIASGRGGATAILLNPRLVAEAQLKLEELKPMVVAEMQGAIERIRDFAASEASVDRIFAEAHDVRGLAGSYGFAGSGVVAGAIRTYGENRPGDFTPDWPLLRLLAQMLGRTFESPDATPGALASLCREAVTKVMAREGREPPEGAF